MSCNYIYQDGERYSSDPRYKKGYDEGRAAVRMRPKYAPQNPYDPDASPDLFDGWDDGADDSGLTSDYHNGVLIE